MKSVIILLSFIIPFTGFSHTVLKPATSREVITSMLSAIENVKGLKYTFKSYERLVTGKQFFTEMDIKANINPLKVYGLTKSDPNKGVEVLFLKGQWEDKAMVNPGNWLPNVKLSPLGDRMRENQHHTLMQAGFNFLGSIIKGAMKRADTDRPGQFDAFFKYEGDITWGGRQCYKISIEDPDFKYVEYTVQAGDNIDNLEVRKGICGYLIIEKNPAVKSFDGLKPGMKIKIPTSYAKKTVLYIDKQSNLPIVQIMSDEVGEFEKYEFHNLVVNPAFAADEFTPDFSGYDF
ncbi:MAG: DUF1571 domain-containing protein [Chitinophagales bacterium]|nr:DUF1571 domain-containing protein [Chitinophagales bacterium]